MTAPTETDQSLAPPPLVHSEKVRGIARITLSQAHKRNTLSRAMLRALRDAVTAAREDPEVKVVILAAEGPVFSSGHDMKELVGADEAATTEVFTLSTEVMEAIRLMPKPVIAQVQGLASAAGCQLAASCDLAVAADTAGFQTPGVQIGLFCSTPAVPLARSVHTKKAMEMLLTGEPIDADAAERVGLVNRVVPGERLEQATAELAEKILSYSGQVIGMGKTTFYRQLPLSFAAAYDVAKDTMVRNSLHEEAQEGMSAFLEKRRPRWKH